MDEPIYEAYEFLQDDDESQNASQFLVVQNDGTFLTVNRPIQYITQGENVKTVLEGTPKEFNGSQQEFFVHNSEELITDQFVVADGENSEYTNSFLLKTIENVKSEVQNEQPEYVVPDYGISLEDNDEKSQDDAPEELANAEEKVPSQGDCTEITLTDEQYQQLQEKGWLLLESMDKIYLLDSVGLHDITDNPELIEKLRSEIDDQNPEPENNSSNADIKELIKIEVDQQTTANVIEQDAQETEDISETPNSNTREEFKEESREIEVETSPEQAPVQPVLSHNPIKIKTNYLFKDIPARVVLGRTAKGQDLVARVVKTNRPMADSTANLNNHPTGPNYTGISETRFEKLIRQKLNECEDRTTKADLSAAETVVKQLLSVPSFRNVVLGRQLVITKTIIMETTVGQTYWENKCTLVTGKVGEDEQGFEYVPGLLNKLLSDGEAILYFRRTKDINEGSFLHIHVSEMKAVDGIVRVSITLNKRHLPLKLVKEQIKLRQVYACSSCAVMFESEELLRHHQQTECMEVDDPGTTATDQKSAYTVIIEEGKEKKFVCNQCQMTFTKLSYCQRHVKIHFNNENETSAEDGTAGTPMKKVYKCKMCPSAYSHPSTLSKHIVAKHIQAEVSMLNRPKVIKTYAKNDQIKTAIQEASEKQNTGKGVYYKCKMCPSTYVHPATLTKHILSEHVKSV